MRIYFKFLFTAEAQRTLRDDNFCLSGDDDKQKGLHLEDSDLWLGRRPRVFAQSPSPDWAKVKFSANSAPLRLNTYTPMYFFSDFDIRILDFIFY